jgi:cytoskeletal protein RodZ
MIQSIVLIAILFLGISVLAEASTIPESYWGFVKIDNQTPSEPVSIDVYTRSGEHVAHVMAPVDEDYPGSYHLVIPFSDFDTYAEDVADPYEDLVWKINNISAKSPAPYSDQAEPSNINPEFNLQGIKNPDILYSFNYPSSVSITNPMTVSAILTNLGEGDAFATIDVSGEPFLIENNSLQTVKLEPEKKEIINFTVVPQLCGKHNLLTSVNYSNAAGDIVGRDDKPVSVTVRGNDLALQTVRIEPYDKSDTASFTVFVTSNSERVHPLSSITLYLNGQKAKTITKDIMLEPFARISVEADFGPLEYSEGDELRFVINEETLEQECNMQNNEYRFNYMIPDPHASENETETNTSGVPSAFSKRTSVSDDTNQSDEALVITQEPKKQSMSELWYLLILFIIGAILVGLGIVVFGVTHETDRHVRKKRASPSTSSSTSSSLHMSKNRKGKHTQTPSQTKKESTLNNESKTASASKGFVDLGSDDDKRIPDTIDHDAPPSKRYGPQKQKKNPSLLHTFQKAMKHMVPVSKRSRIAKSTAENTRQAAHDLAERDAVDNDIEFMQSYLSSSQEEAEPADTVGSSVARSDSASHFIQSDILSTQALDHVRNSLTIPRSNLSDAIAIAQELVSSEDETEYEGVLQQLLSSTDYNPTLVHLVNTALLSTDEGDDSLNLSEETLPESLTFTEFKSYLAKQLSLSSEDKA